MTGRVHLLVPGSRERVRCGTAWRAQGLVTTRKPSAVTCHNCLGNHRGDPPPPTEDQLVAREYVGRTTLVAGRRREILACECGAFMVAGLDHTCDPRARRSRGVSLL